MKYLSLLLIFFSINLYARDKDDDDLIKKCYDLEKEMNDLSGHPLYQWLIAKLDRVTPTCFRSYVLPVFAGIISATPLPDEFTAAIVHASKNMSYTVFATVSFFFNAFGVFIILLIGRII